MRKTLLHRLYPMLLACLLAISCTQNELETYTFDEGSLDATGHAFMDVVKTSPAWKQEWSQFAKTGTPLPNEALTAMGGDYGHHYILPLVKDREILGLVIYPLMVSRDEEGATEEVDKMIVEGVKPAIVLNAKSIKEDLTAHLFLKSRLFEEWSKKGLYHRFDLQAIESIINDKRGGATTRSSNPLTFTVEWYVATKRYLDGAIRQQSVRLLFPQ